jgi:choloylglycine hydrolase
MCTSLAMKTNSFYFGRNMDIERHFGEHVVIAPRNYVFSFRRAGILKQHYAMIGMANVTDQYPLYAEAVNEKGLCIAGLHFPDAVYDAPEESSQRYNLSPFELIPWLLGNCASLAEAKQLLSETHLVAIPFCAQMPLTPLHWHIADKTGSLVLEVMKDGMHLHENPVHVLTNSPPFPFHMTNLSLYLNLTVKRPENCFYHAAAVEPFGKGLGSFGLPGDFSPTSRFVKAAYLLLNSKCNPDEAGSVSQFFHLLDAVAVVSGSIVPPQVDSYTTTYSCCVNVAQGIYYYKTYTNNQISAVNLHHVNLDTGRLREYPLVQNPQVAWQN